MFSIGHPADRARRERLHRRGSYLSLVGLWIGQKQGLLVLPARPRFWLLRRSSLSGSSRKSRVSFTSDQSALGQTTPGAADVLSGSSPIFPVSRANLFYRHCLFLGTSGRAHRPWRYRSDGRLVRSSKGAPRRASLLGLSHSSLVQLFRRVHPHTMRGRSRA